MSKLLPSRRLLAGDGRGWQVRELLDGTVHLTLGSPGMLFRRDEFSIWVQLLEATGGPAPLEDTLLHVAGPRRASGYFAAQERYLVQFDQFVIMVQPDDLALLTALCRKAGEALAGAPGPAMLSSEALTRN